MRTYRGRTIDELLPQVREELGDDAVIVDRRVAVEGGVGGFFGKRMVELDAEAPDRALPPAPATAPHVDERVADVTVDDLFEAPQPATDFAALFAAAQDAGPGPEPEPEPVPEPEPAPEPVLPPAAEGDEVAARLIARGMPAALAAALAAEAAERAAVFGGDALTAARAILSGSLPVARRAPGTAIAIVGAGGVGKSAAAAALGSLHVQAGRALTILDTDGTSPRDIAGLGALRERVAGAEVQLAVSATASAAVLDEQLAAFAPVAALIVTHADETDQLGAVAGAAITHGVPIAYVLRGPRSIAPADPGGLAEALLS